ncbi:MAG TPA: hypothetical protein PKE47_11455, partial [Verrucomicrobiota bacterium]|nr:hypothetical protein [Verrucomicrobiota bacterium]
VRALEASLRPPPPADGTALYPQTEPGPPSLGKRARAGENRDRLAGYLRINGPVPVPKAREALGMADSSIRVTIAKHPECFRTREDGCIELVNHQPEPPMTT